MTKVRTKSVMNVLLDWYEVVITGLIALVIAGSFTVGYFVHALNSLK